MIMQQAELERLLAQIHYRVELSVFEGLDPFRRLLQQDDDGEVRRFLEGALARLDTGTRKSAEELLHESSSDRTPKPVSAGLAFVLGERYVQTGDVLRLWKLYTEGDSEVRKLTLNALWSEPSDEAMGRGVVELAVQGARDPSAKVRVEAAFVIQNQSAWGTDVTPALDCLRTMLSDPDAGVRRQAAYATGNVGKRKYDLTTLLEPLRQNLCHPETQAREASAWALTQLSRRKYDLGFAVPDLVHALTFDDEYSGPRAKAARALLHHARKSADCLQQVRAAVATADLDRDRKEIRKLLDELELE